jgi:hypothetical protein
MERRQRRRIATWRYARRAQLVHLARNHPTGEVDCVCERSVWYFEKRKSLGCQCRKRKHGQPKRGVGMCRAYDPRPAWIARIRWRALRGRWLQALRCNHADDLEW